MDDSSNSALGFALLKYVVLLASIPIWGPFAKALWEEFVYAMRADGGLTGRAPGPREQKEIEERLAREEPRQVHELLAHHRLKLAKGGGPRESEDLGTPDEEGAGAARGGRPASRNSAPAGRGFRR